MSDNPMEKLRVLQEKLKQIAADLGLELHQAAFIPNPDADGPDLMQAAFLIRPEAVEEPEPEKSEEQKRIDEEFEAILLGDKKASEQEKQAGMVDELKSWLEGKE